MAQNKPTQAGAASSRPDNIREICIKIQYVDVYIYIYIGGTDTRTLSQGWTFTIVSPENVKGSIL